MQTDINNQIKPLSHSPFQQTLPYVKESHRQRSIFLSQSKCHQNCICLSFYKAGRVQEHLEPLCARQHITGIFPESWQTVLTANSTLNTRVGPVKFIFEVLTNLFLELSLVFLYFMHTHIHTYTHFHIDFCLPEAPHCGKGPSLSYPIVF